MSACVFSQLGGIFVLLLEIDYYGGRGELVASGEVAANMKFMIRSLQSLRGVAAIMIVALHFGFHSGMVESFGDCAVAIFMMLSGFVLSLGYHDRVAGGYGIPFRNFMLKRIIRIVPLYLLGLFYSLALCHFHISPSKFIADVLMLQSWIPSPDYYFSGNAPTWFVSDLMLCYLLFIPTITLLNRRPGLFAGLFSLYIIAYILCVAFIPDALVHPVVYIFPPMQFPVFVVGMVLAKVYSEWRVKLSGFRADLVLVFIIALIVCQMWFYPSVSPRLSLSVYWWFGVAGLIVSLSLCHKCMMIKLLSTLPLVTLGNMSYALYIFHIPFQNTWHIICRHLGITLPLNADFVIFTILAITGAAVVHNVIEKPLTRKLDSLLG